MNENDHKPETGSEIRWKNAIYAFRDGDYAGALFLFKKLAQEGSLPALVEVGNIYELGGNGVDQDYIEAKKWYERSVNEIDDSKAYLALGRLYYAGHGVEQDFNKAFFYFSKLENEPGALYILGRMYEYGEGTNKDLKLALSYYKKASELGHALALKDYGLLTIKQGRYLKGFFTWMKACIIIFKIVLLNPDDRRLKVA